MSKKPPSSLFSEVFMTRLTEAQFSLFNYISFLMGDSADACDVLQETNLDLWRKASSYDPSRPFIPWARTIAHYQVLTFRKKQSRERLLFDDEILETMVAQPPDEEDERFSRMAIMLKGCRERLNAFQKTILEARYERSQSLGAIARTQACSVPAVGMALMRVRSILARCVKERLVEEET